MGRGLEVATWPWYTGGQGAGPGAILAAGHQVTAPLLEPSQAAVMYRGTKGSSSCVYHSMFNCGWLVADYSLAGGKLLAWRRHPVKTCVTYKVFGTLMAISLITDNLQ